MASLEANETARHSQRCRHTHCLRHRRLGHPGGRRLPLPQMTAVAVAQVLAVVWETRAQEAPLAVAVASQTAPA